MRLPIKQMFDGVTREIVVAEKHPESIAIMSRYANEKDAKFIVKACNNYDSLLKALQELVNLVDGSSARNFISCEDAIEAIKNAKE